MNTKKFPGFPAGPKNNFWQYPRVLNGWWSALTGSEHKVLDYILRRTWGFGKTYDYICYRQFQYGIQKKNGDWLDKGCGIKRRETIKNAIGGLIRKGFIKARIGKGRKASFFKLVVREMNTTGLKNRPTIDRTISGEREEKKREKDSSPLEEPSPRVEEIFTYFIEVFRETRGFDPLMDAEKEMKLIKNRLMDFEVDQLRRLIRWFLDSGRDKNKSLSPSLSVCFNNTIINKWMDCDYFL